jgi:hypothetical protein
VSDPQSDPAKGPQDDAAEPAFTKDAQPDLPLEQRRKKAGLTRNRIGIWIVVGGFGLYMIGQGIVGILTKAR